MADVDLGMPGGSVSRFVVEWGGEAAGTYALSVFNFGLACCAVEFVAASAAHPDVLRAAGPDSGPASSPVTELMVVSGTVTDKVAPAIRKLYDELPDPKYVLSFGSCSNSGGPYWDSYCVTKGVDQIVPVDVYVPGCPPRPEALLQGIATLRAGIDAR